MKTLDSIAGKTYVVTSPNGCTVTDETGLTLGTVDAGQQKIFIATGAKIQADDDSARITATFNFAPVGLLGSGGGAVAESPLPEDYLEADFIQFDGNDYVLLSDKTAAGDRIVFSTVNQFYDHLTDVQREGKYGAPLFYYGLENGTCRYGFNSSTTNTGIDADTEWHKVTLSYTPSLTFFRIDGESFEGTFNAESVVLPWGMCVGITLNSMYYCYSRKKRTTLQINGVLKADLIPGITAAGNVVFYNVATGANFAGQNKKLRAGLTLPQARRLIKLPDGGGATIRLCLPTNYEEDEYVMAAIAEISARGWLPDIDTYSQGGENVASTFAFRRILVRKTPDPEGNYVDSQGVRYFVEKTQTIIGADPAELGYEAFRSEESAIAYWELEPYVNPEEELLTEYNENDNKTTSN